MQELHLVGFTTDRRHLIFSSRQGAKSGSFLVPVDEELLDAVEGLSADTGSPDDVDEDFDEEVVAPAADTRVDAKLSVREVQARLRAGVEVEEIAARAEVDPAWVERFAPPIRAEQQQVVSRALAARMERPRAGQSALTLREAVSRSMAERDLTFTAESFASAWSSRLVGADRWSIEFTFSHRGRRRTGAWTFEAAERRLTAIDRLASQIGFVAGPDRSPSDGGDQPQASRPPAKRKAAAKNKRTTKKKSPAGRKKQTTAKKATAKKTAAEKRTTKKSTAKTSTAEKRTTKKSTAKKSTAEKRTTKKSTAKTSTTKKTAAKNKRAAAPRKRPATKKRLPTAKRVAAARKDATERLEQATAKRVAAAKKAAARKSAASDKAAKRRVAAEEKAAARAAREAETWRRAKEEAEAESSAAKDREAARAVAAAERQLAEERRAVADAGTAAPEPVEPESVEPEPVEAEPVEPEPAEPETVTTDTPPAPPASPPPALRPRSVAAPAGQDVERRRDQAVVRLRAPLPSVPAEDPAARVAARRARAAERSVSTAQFRSGSAVQAASAPANGAGAAIPEGVRRREPREGESPADRGDGRPRPDGRRTRTRQLRAR